MHLREKWEFENVNFWIKCGYLPQCETVSSTTVVCPIDLALTANAVAHKKANQVSKKGLLLVTKMILLRLTPRFKGIGNALGPFKRIFFGLARKAVKLSDSAYHIHMCTRKGTKSF